MTQLFGKGTIKSHLEVLHGFDDAKVEIIKELHKDWKNGLLIDEVKYKEKFNQIFFGDLLGYENRTHRIPEGTIPGAGSADITLGNFTDGKYELENIQVVCELKGAKTNLTKKQFGHGGLSPVGQGFAYKTGLKNCKRLIVSNFYEIRLYRDNTTDFEIWNLDELLDPKDNYFNLRKLYLLLQKDNLLSAKTENLLSHFREEQQEITKKFYKEYKELRIELINDMRHHNPNSSIEIVIEKAQKIIDRLIFIFFCEDKGLLPDKRLKESILKAGEFDFTPWEITKKFFSSVDKGSEKLGIPHGYNGGLFKEDETLNGIRIGDTICRKFINLTNYNFDDQLSVNVLGHIFEQSISDLENLKIDLLGTQPQTDQLVDTGKGRRKKDGIFYTPEYIVDYIVQNSVMKYLNEKEDECLAKYKKDETKAYQAYQQILQNIKILDPACGSGAFLVRVFDVLFEENKRVGSILNSLFDDTETYKNILTNNIYGVDLNAESVEITKLSLRLKSAQKGKKLNNLDANIKCGNSLIDDPEVAGDKAFDWNEKFKEIMKNGGFDIVVGNPPYGAKLNKEEKRFYQTNFDVFQGNFEVYFFFIETCKKILKSKGLLGFITPDTWIRIPQAQKLREFVLNYFGIDQIVSFGYSVFEDAAVNTIIFIIKKNSQNSDCKVINISEVNKLYKLNNEQFYKYDVLSRKSSEDKQFKILQTSQEQQIINKFPNTTVKLETILDISQGIVPYSIENITKEEVKNRIYHSDIPLDNTYGIWAQGRCLNRYGLNLSGTEYIKYGSRLHRPRKEKYFIGDRILIQEITGGNPPRINATKYSERLFHDPGIISCLNSSKLDTNYILCIINSKLISRYHIINSPKGSRSTFPKVLIGDIRNFPIKEISLLDQQPFIEKADKMLSLNKQLHELTDKFLHRIQDNLKIGKLTKKLQSFYDFDFKDFLDELKKQKISLSLAQQDEREPYFKEYKEKVLLLKGEIERMDKEIDDMVFDLYGLTEEERDVIEGK